MNLRRIVYEAAETLRAVPLIAENEAPVVEMEKGDIRSRVAAEIGRTSCCLVVSLGSFTPTATGKGGLYGTVGLIVSAFEKPVTNRLDEGDAPAESPKFETSPTILNLAQAAANALDRAQCEGMNGPFFLDEITPVVDLSEPDFDGVVTCDAVFAARDLCIS